MAERRRVCEPHPDLGRLSDDNLHHLERVLRLRHGDTFLITDGKGAEYSCVLRPNGAFTVGERQTPQREPRLQLTLVVPLLKGDGFEWVLEKATELGVCAIIPVVTTRCVARDPGDEKMKRWRKIVVAAMLQCGGCRIPEVAPPFTLGDFCRQHNATCEDRPAFFFHEEAPLPEKWTDHLSGSTAATLVTGPEGGFTHDEAGMLTGSGFRPVGLGTRILKAETAPIVGATVLLHRSGDLG